MLAFSIFGIVFSPVAFAWVPFARGLCVSGRGVFSGREGVRCFHLVGLLNPSTRRLGSLGPLPFSSIYSFILFFHILLQSRSIATYLQVDWPLEFRMYSGVLLSVYSIAYPGGKQEYRARSELYQIVYECIECEESQSFSSRFTRRVPRHQQA